MLLNALAVVDFGISNLPPAVFTVIHLAALGIAGYLAYRAFQAGGAARLFGWGFTLYALGEISYILYHVQPPVTTFLFSHTISEVLALVAWLLVFAGFVQTARDRKETKARPAAAPGKAS